ncbi:hypothetical protein RLIN73S_00368 [Rhodanobacter lindaniclasticus]
MQALPNGLQVISVRRANLPLVTAQLWVRRGGEMHPPQLAGLADLTANLLSKGAAGKSAPRMRRQPPRHWAGRWMLRPVGTRAPSASP